MRLFQSVHEVVGPARVLYPGSFVDIAASAVFPAVTYVDSDGRAPSFFADEQGVRGILDRLGGHHDAEVDFLNQDYRDLQLKEQSFDLLISLYAGFVSEHCTRFLRIRGTLLVNSSHGDAAMAALDPRYSLSGVVVSRDSRYSVRTGDLAEYMIPKRPVEMTREMLHNQGRGIAYTKPAFAYLFTRVA